MTAQAVLAELERRGVSASVNGDKLHLAPAEVLDEALIAEARRHKPELLRLVARHQVVTPAECCWCGATLVPYLLDMAGRPALLCPTCHKWTLAGDAA